MDWGYTALIAIVSAFGGAFACAVPLYLKLRGGISTIRKDERKDALDEFRELLDKTKTTVVELSTELRQVREENRASLSRENECLRISSRQGERILSLEDALRSAKIPFRPWDSDVKQDIKDHPPLGADS